MLPIEIASIVQDLAGGLFVVAACLFFFFIIIPDIVERSHQSRTTVSPIRSEQTTLPQGRPSPSQPRTTDHDFKTLLANRSALIFGAGRVGWRVAEPLGQFFRHITLVDFDILTPENLSRGAPPSCARYVGMLKAAALHQHLTTLYPNLNVTAVTSRVREEDKMLVTLIEDHDVTIICLDDLTAWETINQATYRLGKPSILGVLHDHGQTGTIVASIRPSPCLRCAMQTTNFQHDFVQLQAHPVPSQAFQPLTEHMASLALLLGCADQPDLRDFPVHTFNQVSFRNPNPGSLTRPEVQFDRVSPRPSCRVCNP